MLYVEFTHSQNFETFLRCHQHAFAALQGVSHECWYDNLLTAVAEHDGRLVRFQPRFLAFAREYGFYPHACNPGAGWEKGKVEKGGVAYLRSNFWPLRTFTDLTDVNRQVRQWLDEVANVRLHRETRQRPCDRFRPDTLRPLPALAPDDRDTATVLVHKDLRWNFDANHYCAPPRFVGQHLTAKGDASSVTLYDRQGAEIVRYARCWRRGRTLGGERFQKELLQHHPAALRSEAQQRLLKLLQGVCPAETVEAYLRGLADSDRRRKNRTRLRTLAQGPAERLSRPLHQSPGSVRRDVRFHCRSGLAQAHSTVGPSRHFTDRLMLRLQKCEDLLLDLR